VARRRGHGEGTIYRRASGGWAGALTISIDGSGRQRRRYIYGASQREVRSKLGDLRRKLDAGIDVGSGRSVTVGQYLDSWMTDTLDAQVVAGSLRASTRDNYSTMVERHIAPHVGHYRLEDLKPPHLRAWIVELRAKTTTQDRPLSARTIQLAHATLRRALNDAVRDELIARNPALLVQAGRVTRSNIAPLTLEEAKTLLAVAATDRLYALWLVLMSLGLRRGEALALRWSDFDGKAQTVRVSRSLQRERTSGTSTRGRFRGVLIEMPPKTEGSIRVLAVPTSLSAVLKQHWTRQKKERLAAKFWADPDLVFTTSAGTPFDPQNIYKAWHDLCDRAGVRRCRPHDLRHTAASFLLLQGADMRTVMDQLGHTRMATTSDLYTHVLDEVKRDAANRMDGLLRDILPPKR
jgi:integrase